MTLLTTPTDRPPATLRTCRACRGTLDPFFDLGEIQLSGYLTPEEVARPTAPLVLCACSDCRLVQLQHTTAPDLLFKHYWYRSGVNELMRAELQDVVDTVLKDWVRLEPHDVVLDIGANDGTLLARYQPHAPDVLRVAYEPAWNLQAVLEPHAEVLVTDYFPEQYPQVQAFEGRVKVITSIAMVYAVDDLARFLAAVARLLHQDGVWVVQFQDLAGMLKTTAFDNICHEHLCYFSLDTFSRLLRPYGLAVVDVDHRAINGGSYRLLVQHAGHPISPRVAETWAAEIGCQDWTALERFCWRVHEVKRQIRTAIEMRRRWDQVIDLYGASTKANTLLQVCGLDRTWLRQAWERSPEKVGRRTAGTDIPIVDEETGRRDPPDALLCGIWQFREAVLAREAEFLRRGTVIFPLPTVDIVTRERGAAHAHA